MADKKFTQLPVAGALTVNDLLAIAQSPFGAGSSKSITGTVLGAFINAEVASAGVYLPKAGGTLTGALLFTDNTLDIGASGATRPRTLFAGTSVDSPTYRFGGTTNAFPALSRTTTVVDHVLADASGPCQISCGANALGGASTVDGLLIKNLTAAALGAQQWSPSLSFLSYGWGTTASTSQSIQWRIYSSTVQAAVPTSLLKFDVSVNGGAFNNQLSLSNTGTLTPGPVNALGNVTCTAAGFHIVSGRSKFGSTADGLIEILNNGGTDFTRLNFGGSTASFPAIARSTTNLILQLGDGTGNAGLTTGALTTVACRTSKYLGINGATVLDATHYCVNATANTFDVTLPTAVSVAGRTYVIKNSGTGVVTLKANGAETIDGSASWTINQYTSLTAMSDGAGWILI